MRCWPDTVPMTSLVLRPATSADAAELERLAALDSAEPLTGEVLLAHASGQVRAAVSLQTGRSIADPFYPSADLVALLRAATGTRSRRPWRRSARPAVRPVLA